LHFSTATHSQVTGEQGQCQGFWPGECVSDLWEERSGFTGFFLKHFSYYFFFAWLSWATGQRLNGNKKAKPITCISLPRPPQINNIVGRLAVFVFVFALCFLAVRRIFVAVQPQVPGTDRQRQN